MRAALSMLAFLAAAGPALAQSGGSIAEEAVRAAEEAQRRDKERVDAMSRDAAKATEAAPSGVEAVAPATGGASAGTASPAAQDPVLGLTVAELMGRPVQDRGGIEIGPVRDVVLAADGRPGQLMIEQAGTVRGVEIATLRPLATGAEMLQLTLDADEFARLPAFQRIGNDWQPATR